MIRARFKADPGDYRPVKWPAPGPFWCSGSAGDGSYSIVIAYAKDEDQIREYWPEARDIDAEEKDKIIFTDRFARPDWWPSDRESI